MYRYVTTAFAGEKMSFKSPRSKYDRALQLAQETSEPTREAYDLLITTEKESDPRASYALATWYLHGSKFTAVNKKRAVQLLKKSAKGGVADAAHDLAVAYEKGDGVDKSPELAFESNVLAALLGDAQSFYEVGRMYFHGIGVAKNRRLAKYWLAKAEALGIDE